MNNRSFLEIVAALAILALPLSAAAHEGHNQNLSDEEMLVMEAAEASGPMVHSPRQTQAIAHDGDVTGAHSMPSEEIMSPQELMQYKIESNRLKSVGDLMARLHPVAAHFPIALLMFAAFAEIVLIIRPNSGAQATVRFLIAGGAVGALATTILGWIAGGWRLTDRSEMLAIHRWNGTTVALLSLLAWWLAARGQSRLGLRIVLAIIFSALVVQGYVGGEMAHGPNHMGMM